MCSLHFFCPTHERSFEPGFDVDDDTFARHRLKIVRLDCPWCGRMHRFLLADGRRHIDVPQPHQLTRLTAAPPLAPRGA